MSNVLNGLIEQVLNPLILLIFSLGFLVFLWGVAEFLRSGANPEKNNEGKEHMLWGVVGMFVMLSAYAIITIIINTFGIDPTRVPTGTGNGTNQVQPQQPVQF